MNVGCVLLAAGSGKRFGGNKLTHVVCGATMIEHALGLFSGLPFCVRVCVTRSGAETVCEGAKAHGFVTAINPDPERGVGTSAAIGTLAAQSLCPALDGLLFAVCDQPYLGEGSVKKLTDAFVAHPDNIVSLCWGGERGNPAIFPKKLFSELSALDADVGGGAVIRKHPELLLLVEAGSARELADVDTRA